MKNRVIAVILFTLCFHTLPGIVAGNSLMDLYRESSRNDPLVLSATHALRGKSEIEIQAKARLKPQIQAGGQVLLKDSEFSLKTDNPFLSNFSDDARYTGRGFSLVLRQPLIDLSSRAAYEGSKAQVVQAGLKFAMARQDLILRVAQAYFGVLYAKTDLEARVAERDALNSRLRLVAEKAEAGMGTQIDLDEARARYDLSEAFLATAQSDLSIARESITLLVGITWSDFSDLKDPIPIFSPEPGNPEVWAIQALSGNLMVQASEKEIEVAREVLRAARYARFPVLDLRAEHQWTRDRFAANPSETAVSFIGLQFQWSLFQGGAIQSRIRQKEAFLDEVENLDEYTRRSAVFGSKQAYFETNRAVSRVGALKQVLLSSESALASVEQAVEVGLRTMNDELDALQRVFAARRDLAHARYAYFLGSLRLQATVGSLSEEDLVAIDGLLED